MNDLKDKVAIVTGASSGIGARIVKELLQLGMKVVGLARRKEKIEEINKGFDGNLFAVQTDVTKEDDIVNAFKWTEENVGPVYVLINCAGVAFFTGIEDAKAQDFKQILETNLLAMTIFTREAIKAMKVNNIDGIIININGAVGHYVPPLLLDLFMSITTKHGVTALTESIRAQLARSGSKIRVTSLSPGLVESEVSREKGFLDIHPYLKTEDIAKAVTYILSQPKTVNVAELTIRPTAEIL